MQVFTKITISALCVSLAVVWAAAPVSSINRDVRGLALHGYDPVAYFTQSRPVSGSPAITTQWMGATWRFSSAANRDAFQANPEQYAPQFGGYCAYAVSRGYVADISPDKWRVVDGKLYLNHPQAYDLWLKDIPGNIAKANGNWPKIEKK